MEPLGGRGSVLVEALIVLLVAVFPMFCFGLELYRVSSFHAVMHAMAFRYVRAVGLGTNEPRARHESRALFGRALPPRVRQGADLWVVTKGNRLEGKVRYRYSSFVPYWLKRIQITKSCPFYFSR